MNAVSAPWSATRSPTDDRRALAWFLCACALMSLLSVLPVLAYPHPALGDRLNHLARLYLTADLAPAQWHGHYFLNGQLAPNLAQELVCMPLVRLGLSPEWALNLFTAGLLLLQGWAVIAVGWVGQRRLPWWALWAFPLSAGRYFLWGFLNYGFSLAVAFCALLTWMLAERSERRGERTAWQLATAALLLLCVLSHMIGWGVAVTLIGLWQLGRLLSASPAKPPWARSAVVFLAVLLPSLVLYGGWMRRGSGHAAGYYDVLKGKLAGLASPFATFLPSISAVTAVAFVLVATWLLWRRGFLLSRREPAPWLPVAGLLLLFLVMPASLMGSVFLDRRLFAPAVLAALALWPVAWPSRRGWLVAVAAVVLVHGARTAEFLDESRLQSQSVEEIRAALKAVPLGDTVVGLNFTDSGRLEVPALLHAPSLAVADRGAFVPSLFAEPKDRMPVTIRDMARHRAVEGGRPSMENNNDPRATVNWAGFCATSGHLLVTWSRTAPRRPQAGEFGCLQPVSSGEHWQLYRTQAKAPAP